MDIIDVGAALILTDGAATKANAAAETATEKAGEAETAATAANNAAEAANQAAAGYQNLGKDADEDRVAFNMLYTITQAETRELQSRLEAAETALESLT